MISHFSYTSRIFFPLIIREILQTVGIDEAYTYINANPHARLWRLLAEASLEQLNFSVADKAFVKCVDYQGIQVALSLLNRPLFAVNHRSDTVSDLYMDPLSPFFALLYLQ